MAHLLLASVVSTSLAGRPARAADSVVLQLDWMPGGIAAGWYYGIAQHCFSDRNIALTVRRGYGAGDAITKVAAGASQFGFTDIGAMIAARAQTGAPVKALLPVIPESPFGIAVMRDSPVLTLKDLEGKRVGTSPGNAGMEFLPLGMKANGADFSKITPVTAEAAALPGLLFQSRVDAVTSYSTTAMQTDAAAHRIGRSIRLIPFVLRLGLYNVSLFTSDRMIADRPDLVKRFRDGAVCAFDGSRLHVDSATDALVAAVSGLQREDEAPVVAFSYRLAFDNLTFKAHGFVWDKARVVHTIAAVKQAEGFTSAIGPTDVLYIPN
jgi:NitT/TauT family transport system substrate-binding protein